MTSVENQPKKDYPLFVTVVFLLILISSFGRSITKFISGLSFGNPTLAIISFICELANCVFIVAILRRKRWGLIALFAMLIAQIPVNLILGNTDIETIILSTFIRIAIFSLLLLIRSEGVSGWSVLFGEKQNESDSFYFYRKNCANENTGPKDIGMIIRFNEERKEKEKKKEKEEERKRRIVSFINKPVSAPLWAIFAMGIGVIALIIIISSVRSQSDVSLPEYFYVENGPIFHLNPKCKEGLHYYDAENVYSYSFPSYSFCARCISPQQLQMIKERSTPKK